MEHEVSPVGVEVGYDTEHERVKETKETKMEGIDVTGLAAVLKQNGFDGNQKDYWSNPIYWLLILGFLRGGGGGGLFGGGDKAGDSALAAEVAANSAKLDCLQQGQTEQLMRSLSDTVNANIANLSNRVIDTSHASDMAAVQRDSAARAAAAACCCDLKAGQERIINEFCKQNQLLTATITAGNQRILDSIERHADEEQASKLADAKSDLSNCRQTNTILDAIRDDCGKDWGHRGGRRAEKT